MWRWGISSTVEHLRYKQKVIGSNPIFPLSDNFMPKKDKTIDTHKNYHPNLEIASIANQNQVLLIYQQSKVAHHDVG